MPICCNARGCDRFFGPRFARRMAARYRKRGLDRAARRMVGFLEEHGVAGATVMEVGGGIGDIQIELLKRGATRTVNLELSPGYDGEPVSFGGFGGLTPNGIRIGPIYTPPELRRRGYASALTAALTQMLLDRGRRFCFLFTDLANPTSNSIYQRIGFRPIGDYRVVAF